MKKISSLIVVMVALTVLASCGDGRHSKLQNLYGGNAGGNGGVDPSVVSGLQCVNVGNVSTIKANSNAKVAVASETMKDLYLPCVVTNTCTMAPAPTTGGTAEQPAPTAPAVDSKKECVKAALARMSLIGYWKEGKYFYSADATMKVPGSNAITEIKFESCDQVETANCILSY